MCRFITTLLCSGLVLAMCACDEAGAGQPEFPGDVFAAGGEPGEAGRTVEVAGDFRLNGATGFSGPYPLAAIR